jgi:hypothetical protein
MFLCGERFSKSCLFNTDKIFIFIPRVAIICFFDGDIRHISATAPRLAHGQ